MTLPELLAALERADGPSRELDALIEAWLYERENSAPAEIACDSDNVERGHYWVRIDGGRTLYSAPPITASVDAALALVERVLPGRDITLETSELMTDGRVRRICDATIGELPYSDGKPTHAYGNSPALALCLALVRAAKAEGKDA